MSEETKPRTPQRPNPAKDPAGDKDFGDYSEGEPLLIFKWLRRLFNKIFLRSQLK